MDNDNSVGEKLRVSVARNTAWDSALFEYVAFLDADDAWHPEKLRYPYKWLRDHPDIPASGHKYVLLDPGAPLPSLQPSTDFDARPITRNRLLLSILFVTPSVMQQTSKTPRRVRGQMGARAFHRILKLARTIADLARCDKIETPHLAEAIQYRPRKQV